MEITKEEIIKKVNDQDTNWFYQLYSGDCSREARKEFDIVYDLSLGDGNEYNVTLHFKNFDLYVNLEGTYSSWDSPTWDSVLFSEPYEYKETRYKSVGTYADIREKKIDKVLKEEK